MISSSPTAYLSPPSGELLVEVVIAGLPADKASRFAQLCSERLERLRTGPTAAACQEHVATQLEWDGWNRVDLPAGMLEAQELGLFAYLLPSHGISAEGFATVATADTSGAEALADERAWCWSTLADLAGSPGMDGVVLGTVADTWSMDFRSMLVAIHAARA